MNYGSMTVFAYIAGMYRIKPTTSIGIAVAKSSAETASYKEAEYGSNDEKYNEYPQNKEAKKE